MKNIRNIIIVLVIMMFLSCMNLYSYDFNMFKKQLLWFVIGFIMMFIISKISKKVIFKYVLILYIILNILLLYLLLFGSSINGSKAWINFGFFSFQPSEFMKVILIILLSSLAINDRKFVVSAFIYTLIPSVLTFLEPDTGNVIFYLVILMSLLLFYGSLKKIGYSLISLIIFLICFVILYFYNKTLFVNLFGSSFFYRIDRVLNLFNSETYQLKMALIGISSSFPFGIKNFIAVPELCTDFAFTLLIMRSGVIGIFLYVVTNIYFNFNLLEMMSNEKGVGKVLIFLFLFMKLFQEGIHIFMNIGLFPITGITLPFISYGGSSLLSYFLILGIIINNYKDTVRYRVE